MAFNQFFTNINLHSSNKPQLTVDEVEKVQRQRITTLVSHVFQLTYATIFDALIQQEKVNRCNGCAIHHPSQREHSCLMMDSEDGWFYYHDDLRDKIDLNEVHKTAESVCSALGFKLGKSWEAYVAELPKLPWTSVYLTSLELDSVGEIIQPRQLQERILYALYYGPCGVKCKDFNEMEASEDHNAEGVGNVDRTEVQCPENIIRKEEKLMDLDYVINEIQNKFYF